MYEYNEIRAAIDSHNIDALWKALAKINKREGAPFLAEVLLEEWHDSHEDIVFELGLIGEPSTTNTIAKAAVTSFEYLVEWGNLQAFQRKCAYALARIGTSESRAALELLSKNSDEYISEYGKEGLEHWPMPYREGEYT
jgi:PBS lyase HEAT-like repeat